MQPIDLLISARWVIPVEPAGAVLDDHCVAVAEGRKTRPKMEIGICGEHGGDPESIHLCHKLGLNYVSCSPFRVPVARLAAAQAAIGDGVSAK